MQRFAGLTIVLLVCFSSVKGQDRYFSQQFANPMYSNPALTGIFLGDYRTSVTYRSQWPMALENPFSSFALSADVNVNSKVNPSSAMIGLVPASSFCRQIGRI